MGGVIHIDIGDICPPNPLTTKLSVEIGDDGIQEDISFIINFVQGHPALDSWGAGWFEVIFIQDYRLVPLSNADGICVSKAPKSQ